MGRLARVAPRHFAPGVHILKKDHVRRIVPATIALALLVSGFVSCSECEAPFGVCATDLATVRVWYPSPKPARFGRLWRAISLQPQCYDGRVAGPAQRSFPVLLYFGGWPGTSVSNFELIQSLARAGFIVVTRNYPPSSEGPMSFASEAAYEDTLARAERQVRALAGDAAALIDQVVSLNAPGVSAPFAGRLDTTRIGIVGYSFGGAVAAQAAWADRRIAAVVNIDGWLFGDAAIHGVRQPYLVISDDTPAPGPADLASTDAVHRYSSMLTRIDYDRILHNLPLNGGIFMVVAGTEHSDFADRGRRSRLWDALGLAPDRAARVQKLLRAYTIAFFQRALQGLSSPLLEGPSADFPEARLRYWQGTEQGRL